jgi:hypothetical protein
MKDRLQAGTSLSREELDFIGSYETRRSAGGWYQPDGTAPAAGVVDGSVLGSALEGLPPDVVQAARPAFR